jgi:small subunit ribosomal protein S5
MAEQKEKEILKEKTEMVKEAAVEVAVAKPVASGPTARPFQASADGRRKNLRRSPREGRLRPEFDQKIINIRRVARVAAGGRRFNFSVAMVIGNRRGQVGVGTGKGSDTALAIDKALRNAKRNMTNIKLTGTMSIAHDVSAKYSSARVIIMPAPNRGVAAGSALRNVIELAGIRDVTAKIISPSKNQLNVARAAIEALKSLKTGSTKGPETNKPVEKPAPAGDKITEKSNANA